MFWRVDVHFKYGIYTYLEISINDKFVLKPENSNFLGMPICATSSHVHPISGSSQVYLSRQ